MTNPLLNDSDKPVLESEKPRLVYQPPTLTPLDDCDITGGHTNVPENTSGILS